MYAYCGNNPIVNADPTGHAFGAIIGGLVGGIIGGVTAAASGKSVAAGIITGAVTGAIIGGICDGTALAVGAVAGAMIKCATVAMVGNVVNQGINYQIEKNQYNNEKISEVKNTSIPNKTSKYIPEEYPSFMDYIDTGEILKSGIMAAAFVPLSVGGGSLVNTVFDTATQSSLTSIARFIAEGAVSGNVSMLQTSSEYAIQIFEQ